MAVRLLACAAVAFLVSWGLHGFRLLGLKEAPAADTPAQSPWRRVLGHGERADRLMDLAHRLPLCPAPVKGFLKQTSMVWDGGSVYLCGRLHPGGSALYYPVALAVKSSPAELAVLSAALLALVALGLRPALGGRRVEAVPLVAGACLLVFFLVPSFSKKQLGLRYVLILYPLALVLALHLARTVSVGRFPRAVAATVFVLAAAQLASASRALPYPLAYFNAFAGGPDAGARYLDDSNLDWGQGLVALAEYQSSAGGAALGLLYFGSVGPRAYGVETVPPAALLDGPPPGPAARRLLAVSATLLCRDALLRPLRDLRPVRRVARSVYVYDAREPEVAAVLRRYCARESLAAASGR